MEVLEPSRGARLSDLVVHLAELQIAVRLPLEAELGRAQEPTVQGRRKAAASALGVEGGVVPL